MFVKKKLYYLQRTIKVYEYNEIEYRSYLKKWSQLKICGHKNISRSFISDYHFIICWFYSDKAQRCWLVKSRYRVKIYMFDNMIIVFVNCIVFVAKYYSEYFIKAISVYNKITVMPYLWLLFMHFFRQTVCCNLVESRYYFFYYWPLPN